MCCPIRSLSGVARQVQATPESWAKYGERDVTRREHAQELRIYLSLLPFGLSDFAPWYAS